MEIVLGETSGYYICAFKKFHITFLEVVWTELSVGVRWNAWTQSQNQVKYKRLFFKVLLVIMWNAEKGDDDGRNGETGH